MQIYISGFIWKNEYPTNNILRQIIRQGPRHLKRVVWTCKTCIDSFIFCKPII